MIKTRTTLTKLLAEHKIVPVEIRGAGRTLCVTLQNDKDKRKFCKKIANWGGYSTGWNGWVLSQDYTAPVGSEHDYCNVASHHHY